MIDCGRRLVTAAVGVLVFAAAAAAGPLQDDLSARRARLIERLGPNALAVFWSAEPKVYSLDTDYEFRQDSDMLHLTGIAQEGAILVLMPGNRTQKEILFVREPNPRREHWNGHGLTKEEATAQSGIKKVYYAGEFESFLTAMFNRRPYGLRRSEVTDEYDTFFDAVGANRATLALKAPNRPHGPAEHRSHQTSIFGLGFDGFAHSRFPALGFGLRLDTGFDRFCDEQ